MFEQYYFYISQLIFVLVSFISVKEEVNGTWAFRTFAPPRTIQSKLYHKYGAQLIAIMIGLAAFGFCRNLKEFILLVFINWAMYWWLFDTSYAKAIGEDKYYLGQEASTDRWLKAFGKKAGRNKAYFCIGAIIVLNILQIIL